MGVGSRYVHVEWETAEGKIGQQVPLTGVTSGRELTSEDTGNQTHLCKSRAEIS